MSACTWHSVLNSSAPILSAPRKLVENNYTTWFDIRPLRNPKRTGVFGNRAGSLSPWGVFGHICKGSADFSVFQNPSTL